MNKLKVGMPKGRHSSSRVKGHQMPSKAQWQLKVCSMSLHQFQKAKHKWQLPQFITSFYSKVHIGRILKRANKTKCISHSQHCYQLASTKQKSTLTIYFKKGGSSCASFSNVC